MTHAQLRRILTVAWVIGVGAALYLALFHRDLIVHRLRVTTEASMIAGGAVYFVLGCLRGFTLIPATSLLIIGLLFFPPVPLFFLTMGGALISSASIYYFSGALHVEELLQRKHADQIDRVRALLDRRGLPIIIAWAFFPVTPTDLICYLSGVLRINIFKLLFGVAIGKGGIVATYLYLGSLAV